MENPIIVSGPPRSGTTFMQWFLSQHPRIHIHGQEPKLPWGTMLTWLDEMIEAGKWGGKSNKSKDVKDYEIPHYAGSPEGRTKEAWKQMIKTFLTGYGPEKPRWGVKCLWLCTNKSTVRRINSLWPDTKWIICLRDPFTSFESQKNTFVKDMDLVVWIRRWLASVEFIEEFNGFVIQVDKLNDASREERKEQMNRLLGFLGEEPSAATDDFLSRWPRIHKVRSDDEREFTLGNKRKKQMKEKFSDLTHYMKKYGY